MKLTKRLTCTIFATSLVTLVASPIMAAELTIAGVVFQQDQFFRTIQMGMNAAAKAAGVKLLEGNSDSKAENEIRLVDTYVARGVDAIVISPISPVASIPTLKRAADAGVRIVTFNTNVEDSTIPASFLTSNQRDLGKTTGVFAANFIANKLGGTANVATLGFKAAFAEIDADRVNGFLEEAGKGVTLKVVSQQDAWLAEKAVQVAGDIITANPDLNIIYAANEGGTVGAVQAVRNAGKQGKIFVFGVDGSEQLVSFLLDGDNVLQAVTAQQPFVMGQMAVEAAIAAVKGEEVTKSVSVPVLGLSRTDIPAVKKFQKYLKTLQ